MRIKRRGSKHHWSIKKRALKKDINAYWDFQREVENWQSSEDNRTMKKYYSKKNGKNFRSYRKAFAYDFRKNPNEDLAF
jgi:hypothetical protein